MDTVIPVTEQPEPTAPEYDFHHDVYERGEDAVRQLAGLAPLRSWPKPIASQVDDLAKVTHNMIREYDYWKRAMPALHKAYSGHCAYLARYIEWAEIPTTDHFVALKNATDPMLAYTWSNYRLAHALVNGAKSNLADVIDPFGVKDGWFALDFGTFKTVVGPTAPAGIVDKIKATIRVLGLAEGYVAATRRRAAERYWQPPPGQAPLPLWHLEQDEPFLVRELRRQGRLNPGDT